MTAERVLVVLFLRCPLCVFINLLFWAFFTVSVRNSGDSSIWDSAT